MEPSIRTGATNNRLSIATLSEPTMNSLKDTWEGVLNSSGLKVRSHGRFKGFHTRGPVRSLGPHTPNEERAFWLSESEHYFPWEPVIESVTCRKRRRKPARVYMTWELQEKCLRQKGSTKGRYLIVANTLPRPRRHKRSNERTEKRFQVFEQKVAAKWTGDAIKFLNQNPALKRQVLSIEKNAPLDPKSGLVTVTLEYVKHLYGKGA